MASQYENETLGDIVSGNYQAAAVFERYGLDFCCGGRISLGDACRLHQVDLQDVVKELESLDMAEPAAPSEDAADLVAHIVAKHHAYVRSAIPSIQAHLSKVGAVHGTWHPELHAIARNFNGVADELMQHMVKEEQVLFPYIRGLAEAVQSGAPPPPDMFGTVQNPIRMMEIEHQHVGEELATIRSLSSGYEPPQDACTTYRLVYAELGEFERDLHRHVHLENNMLFPRAVELETQLNRKAHIGCETLR